MTLPLDHAADLFDLDPAIAYLDSAAITPIPRPVQAAGVDGFLSKSRPWARDRAAAEQAIERARALAARVIGATADDMAVAASVSYAIATAAANLRCAPGDRILVLAGDHTSQALTWTRYAVDHGAVVDAVPRPADGDWTAAILARIHAPGPRIAIAALAQVIWNDGALIDLDAVCRPLRAAGTAIVLDLTQSAGMLAADVTRLDADFAAFPTYKWLLGPYSLAFMYVAPRWQGGRPLEENSFNRQLDDRAQSDDASHAPYAPGARRFDRGERDGFAGLPSAAAGLDLVLAWSIDEIAARVRGLMDRLTTRLADAGFALAPAARRSPHILGLRGLPPDTVERCRALGVCISQRSGMLRISLHVFNTHADVDRCAAALIAIRDGAAGRRDAACQG